jgi:PhzF family phenazine biosynthesis protein
MQQIARELKGFVSEVVYLAPEEDCLYLRYYSAECEVDFCGHGTIAAVYDYIRTHTGLRSREVLKIRVKDTYLDVYNRLKSDGSVMITAPAPLYKEMYLQISEISRALSLAESSIDRRRKIALINAGLNTLIVPLDGLDTSCK